MIPILKRLNYSLYRIELPRKIFPAFVEKYVLNLPVGTRFELQGRDWNDRIVRIEFVRTETGFLYQGEASNEGGQAFMSHYVLDEGIITPDAWLDLVIYPCIRPFYDMKIHLAQASVRIWTSRDPAERWINEESFSTVAFLEMNRTRYSRSEGKRVLTSLMDLPPVLNERTEESMNQRVEYRDKNNKVWLTVTPITEKFKL
ncbi:uncharacterized protein TNCT_602361 [Trichonephila clavata]|uniref:Uncharacterized protein n=1 Tax=Trichonephila clavata TaxID=2740835 RepID=A0A8X6H332_TRICU|nr:uncharacterized protein TNCT_602361 [Trichonephila clavata]